VVRAVAQDARSQARNRELALERLAEKIADGLSVPPERRATRPTRASRERRLESKRRQGERKRARRRPGAEDEEGAGRRRKRRERESPVTVEYVDDEGNVLALRESLSAGTIRKIGANPAASAAASQDDAWRRRNELLFERLTVSWEIAGL